MKTHIAVSSPVLDTPRITKPRLLDLFCGAGGAAKGYQRAGFHVVGVDIEPQPRYCGEQFVQADALDFLRWLIHGTSRFRPDWSGYRLANFDAIHASPPCQAFSSLRTIRRFATRQHPQLIEPCRELLQAAAVPYVMENVPGAPLKHPVLLCGSMFGLGTVCDGMFHQLRRHRLFETSCLVLTPPCRHIGRPVGVYGNGGAHRRIKNQPGINGFTGNATERRQAMGIDWMSRHELSQAIPPAYTEFLGRQLRETIHAHHNSCSELSYSMAGIPAKSRH